MSEVPAWVGERLAPRLGERLGAMAGLLRRPVGAGRPAAVLVLLGARDDAGGARADGPPEAGDLEVLLIRKHDSLRSHAGQVAFPGGRAEAGDTHRAATAVREAVEEVGLDPATATVVAELPGLWVPPTDHDVTPVLAWWHRPGPLVPDGEEVDAVRVVPLAQLADPAGRVMVRFPSGIVGPGFDLPDGFFVWGFTAAILDGLLDAADLGTGWDTARVVEPPQRPRPGETAR